MRQVNEIFYGAAVFKFKFRVGLKTEAVESVLSETGNSISYVLSVYLLPRFLSKHLKIR